MISHHDEEWNEMKSGWQAMPISEHLLVARLRGGLRLRMLGSWSWSVLELLTLMLLGVMVGLQIAMGQTGVAAALAALTAFFGLTSYWARSSPLRGGMGSLPELVELTIARARRSVRFAWANYLTTAATAAYVIGMYFSDVGNAQAAYHDGGRVTVALAILGVYAIGTGVYHRYARRRVRQFAALQQTLSGTL
jgi:hypothetical protein